MERTVQKRLGRFLKKGHKILESITLQPFSFAEISNRPVIDHDNVKSNIIHARLHDPEEIKQSVRNHRKMDQELRAPDSIRPILQPLDFTEDWERLRERAARGNSSRMEDDDDEFELELEFQQKKEAAKRNPKGEIIEQASTEAKTAPMPEKNAVPAAPIEATQTPQGDNPEAPAVKDILEAIKSEGKNDDGSKNEDFLKQLSTKDQGPSTRFSMQKDNLDHVGKAINELKEEEEPGKSHLHVKPATAEASETTEAPKDDFIPVKSETKDGVQEPEKAAIQEYKDRAETANRVKQEKDEFEDAKTQGYQEGFKQGEEKAAMQLKQATSQVIKDISKLIGELETLKKSVLENVQENSYEICQAMGESLLQREFKINPESFATVLRRAISDTVGDEKLKIAVHPEFFTKLNALKLQEFSGILLPDENVKPGDFRIDSNLSVVDGSMKKLISELLDQADVNLFDEKDKAG